MLSKVPPFSPSFLSRVTFGGELDPLPILTRPSKCYYGFHLLLAQGDGLGSIMVVDRFEKYATFMAASADCTADEAARLFMKNVVLYWGLPSRLFSTEFFSEKKECSVVSRIG